MKHVILLTICLLIVSWSFSQTGYPKKIVINKKDTVIAITIEQMQIANNVYLSYIEYKELYDSASVYLDSCIALSTIVERNNNNLKSRILIKDSIISDKNYLIKEGTHIIKQQDKKIHRLQSFNKVLGGLVAAFIVVALLIL
jgi:hypothetical protein